MTLQVVLYIKTFNLITKGYTCITGFPLGY
jgi:hypothetical protein